MMTSPFDSVIQQGFAHNTPFQHYPASAFPMVHPIHWLTSHFAVGGWSPLQRLSGMLTAHMTNIAPHNGFTWHPHRGLEIYTWVLEGTLYHEDTTGGKGDIHAGELQRMFSGHWIEHQELNRWDEPARVIQIWFVADPSYRNLEPHYQQVHRDALPRAQHGDAIVTNLIGNGSPMEHHVTARLTATYLETGKTTLQVPSVGEDLFLYVTDGAGQVTYDQNTYELNQYDVILVRPDIANAIIESDSDLHFLNFYLPPFLDR